MPVTVEEQLERCGFGLFQCIAVTAFVLFIIADGMELVVTNITWSVMPLEEWGATPADRALVVSVAFFGFVVGAVFGALTGDTFGRRPLLYAHSLIFVPASIFSALSTGLIMLISTRFLVGVSVGLVLPTAVALISEFTPKHFRGRAIIALPGAFWVGFIHLRRKV